MRGPTRSFLPALVVIGVGAGIALRLWILTSPLGAIDGDEAVWGVMARHELHGELSVFFWGQPYGGTQESLLTAPLFALFGSGAWTLRVVPVVLWAVAGLLVWRIGRRTLGEPRARLAAALFWLSPAYFVWKSTRAHGFYGSTLVLGLAVVLLAVRLRERNSRADLVMLGLALGLGWWASPQVVILVLPALVWLAWRHPAAARDGWLAVPPAVLGARSRGSSRTSAIPAARSIQRPTATARSGACTTSPCRPCRRRSACACHSRSPGSATCRSASPSTHSPSRASVGRSRGSGDSSSRCSW